MGIPFEESDRWIQTSAAIFKAAMALSRPLTKPEACLVLQWKYWTGEEMTVDNIVKWTKWSKDEAAVFLPIWQDEHRVDLPKNNEAHSGL